jgi:hypothetical protein
MFGVRRLVPLTLAALVFVLLGMQPAAAGGPTSVLLVSPSAGRTSSLYYSDPDYQKLIDLVMATDAAAVKDSDRLTTGEYITVTWLIHDISIWRIDRIYTQATGGALIATQLLTGQPQPGPTGAAPGGPALELPTTWHRAADSKLLVTLLGTLSVLSPGSASVVQDNNPSYPPSAASTVTTPVTARVVKSTTAVRWSWGLGGLAIGGLVGVGVGVAFAASRRMLRPREPISATYEEIYLEPQDYPTR